MSGKFTRANFDTRKHADRLRDRPLVVEPPEVAVLRPLAKVVDLREYRDARQTRHTRPGPMGGAA